MHAQQICWGCAAVGGIPHDIGHQKIMKLTIEGVLSPVSAESLSRAVPRPCRAFSRILQRCNDQNGAARVVWNGRMKRGGEPGRRDGGCVGGSEEGERETGEKRVWRAEGYDRAFSHLRSNSRAMSSSVFPSAVRLHFEAARPRAPSCVLPPLSVDPTDRPPPLPLLRDIPLCLLPLPLPLEKTPCVKLSASNALQQRLDNGLASPFSPPSPSPAPAVKRPATGQMIWSKFDQQILCDVPLTRRGSLSFVFLEMCRHRGGSLDNLGASSHREVCHEPRLDEEVNSRHRDREVLVEAPASRDETFKKCILATRAALLAVSILYAAFRGQADDILQVGADFPEKSMSFCHIYPWIQ
jgi:hypothetical protein